MEKISLFKSFVKSIYDVKFYIELNKKKLGRAFLYLFIISIIFGGIRSIYSVYGFNQAINTGIEKLQDSKVDFYLSNGELNLSNSPFYIHENGNLIYINTNITESEFTNEMLEKENLKKENSTILLFKDKAVITQVTGNNQVIAYSELNLNFDKNSVISLLNSLKWFGIVIVVFSIIFMFLGHMFSALIVAVLSVLLAAIIKERLEFGELYKLSIYALTLPTILAVINSLTGSIVPKFYIIYILCAVAYMGFVIKAFKEYNHYNDQLNEL